MLALRLEPLMVSSRDQLSPDELRSLAIVQSYDFSKIRDRVLKDAVVSPIEVDTAIAEFRKFLALICLGHRSLAMMSGAVDEVWHAFILHTREYAIFCDEVVGRFIHHQPASDNEPISPKAGERFVNAYRTVFGELHPIWGVTPDCDYSKCGYAGCTNCSTEPSCSSVPDCATTNCQDS